MAEEIPKDRSTPRRERNQPAPPPPQAPGPLLALMGSLILILLAAAWLTGEWGFMVLGLVGLAAGLVPILSRK